MSSSHLDRKELKQPDAFVEKTTSVFHYVEKNIKVFATIIVIAIVATTSIFLYRNHLDDIELEAQAKLYPVKKAFIESTSKIKKDETNWLSKAEKDIQSLEKIATELKDSNAAHEAFMTLGNTFFEHANYEKAAENYTKASSVSKKPTLQLAALLQAAYSFESNKKYDQAIPLLEKISKNTEVKALKAEGLISLGRNYELSGNQNKALEAYESYKKEFPNSQSAKTIDALISKLKTKK